MPSSQACGSAWQCVVVHGSAGHYHPAARQVSLALGALLSSQIAHQDAVVARTKLSLCSRWFPVLLGAWAMLAWY